MNTITHRTCVFLTGLGIGVLASSCGEVRDNPKHCWNKQGNETCREYYGDDKPYCGDGVCSAGVNYGCMATMPDPACYSPCGGGKSVDEDDSCVEDVADEGGTESATSTESTGMGESTEENETESTESADTTDTTATTGDAPCNGECVPELCVDEICVDCTAANSSACAMDEWTCDLMTHKCEPCTNHHQCPGDAGCHIIEGTCLPSNENNVLHVGRGQDQDPESLEEAFDNLLHNLDDDWGTVIVYVDSGSSMALTVMAGQVIAVVGVEDLLPVVSADGNNDPSFQLSAGHLYLERVHLTGTAGVQADGTGVVYADSVWGTTSESTFSATGNSELYLRNSILVSDNANSAPAVSATMTSTIDVTYSTLIAKSAAPALDCSPLASGEVSNSIIGSMTNHFGFACLTIGVSVHNNAIEFSSPNNKLVGNFQSNWFVDPAADDFHLQQFNVFKNAAVPIVDDPTVDFDGDPRLDITIAGADVPPLP